MSAANTTLARNFFATADLGRTPVELCAPGFAAYFPGPPPMDLQAYDESEAMIRSAFSDIRHPIDDMVAEGDEVAVRLRFEGTHTGDFMGVPASGKRFSVEGTAFLRIDGNNVGQLWGFLDQDGPDAADRRAAGARPGRMSLMRYKPPGPSGRVMIG